MSVFQCTGWTANEASSGCLLQGATVHLGREGVTISGSETEVDM